MTARDLMTEDPITLTPHDRARDAIDLQLEHDIRHIPVVDERGKLLGMLSDRDLRDATLPLWSSFERPVEAKAALEQPVSEIMQTDILMVGSEDEIGDVIEILLDHKIGAVPVVEDGSTTLVGIISYVDILRAVKDQLLIRAAAGPQRPAR